MNLSGVLANPVGSNGLTCVPGQEATPWEQSANFADFVQTVYFEKNASKGFTEHALESYIQHNPNIPTGRNASITYLSANAPYWEITVVHQGFDSGIGFVHWKLEFYPYNDTSFDAIGDFYRYDGSCIAEHWDAIQPAPPTDRVNPNPLIWENLSSGNQGIRAEIF